MSLKKVPIEPVVIDFDPETTRSHGKIREVFRDEIACALWIMIGMSHSVGPSFEDWCLHTASRIRGVDCQNPQDLFLLLHSTNHVLGHPFFLGGWVDNVALVTRIWNATRTIDPEPVHYEIRIPGQKATTS